eukprot:snap_masked-scaffold_2-processed-gene-6.30-mRNA-1 protein AED:1.00 eAED:1.00 QI:0/0/0/0/1/1/2/0/103
MNYSFISADANHIPKGHSCFDMKRIRNNTLRGICFPSQNIKYLISANELVMLTRNNNEMLNFFIEMQQLYKKTGLNININKTKNLLTNEGYNIIDRVPFIDIN